MTEVVYFAHGQESGPWGQKIRNLAEQARQKGLAVESPDYSHSQHGAPREAQLHSLLSNDPRKKILVGSSMGGWVSCRAARQHTCEGLFLMAPAFSMPDHEAARLPDGIPVWIVHGWQDEVVAPEQSLEQARRSQVNLLLVPDGHRLAESRDVLGYAFDAFLAECGVCHSRA